MWVWPIYEGDDEVDEVDFWGLLAFLWDGPDHLDVAIFAPRFKEQPVEYVNLHEPDGTINGQVTLAHAVEYCRTHPGWYWSYIE